LQHLYFIVLLIIAVAAVDRDVNVLNVEASSTLQFGVPLRMAHLLH